MLLLAQISSFFKTLAIILLVYFALRFLIKLCWPYIVRYLTKKANEKMQSVFKGFQQQSQSQGTGTTSTKDVPKKSKKVVGEYVDYEEID